MRVGCARRRDDRGARTQRARAVTRAEVLRQHPTGINFLLLGYGYTQGEVGFDASTPITDARVHVHAGFLAYSRSLDLWGLSGKVLAALPVADVSGSAKLNGQEVERDVLGLGDPLLRLSVNFFGAPALSMDEYATYHQDVIDRPHRSGT